MLWAIVIAVVVALVIYGVGSSAKKEQAINTELGPTYASHLKTLLKEEFPALSDRFTTTLCMSVYDSLTKFLKERTGKSEFSEGLKAVARMSRKKQAEFERTGNQVIFDDLPDDLKSHIEGIDGGRDRFIKASDAAANMALSEVLKDT